MTRHFNRIALLGATVLAAGLLATTPAAAQQNQVPQNQRNQPQAQTQQNQRAQNQAQPQQTQRNEAQAQQQDRTNRLVIITMEEERNMPESMRARQVTEQELYRGIRASQLMDQDVYGLDGEELGEIQDIFVGRDGRITAIVVEGGGFLDIGDAAFRLPWNEVDLTPGTEGVRVRMTEDTAEAYGLFDGPETLATGPREYRMSELIGDYARLASGEGYGRVSDVVIGRDGRIAGVLVTRDIGWGGGAYAYPYYGYGYGFDPGRDYYGLPFANSERAAAGPRVDHDRFDDDLL